MKRQLILLYQQIIPPQMSKHTRCSFICCRVSLFACVCACACVCVCVRVRVCTCTWGMCVHWCLCLRVFESVGV